MMDVNYRHKIGIILNAAHNFQILFGTIQDRSLLLTDINLLVDHIKSPSKS